MEELKKIMLWATLQGVAGLVVYLFKYLEKYYDFSF